MPHQNKHTVEHHDKLPPHITPRVANIPKAPCVQLINAHLRPTQSVRCHTRRRPARHTYVEPELLQVKLVNAALDQSHCLVCLQLPGDFLFRHPRYGCLLHFAEHRLEQLRFPAELDRGLRKRKPRDKPPPHATAMTIPAIHITSCRGVGDGGTCDTVRSHSPCLCQLAPSCLWAASSCAC